MGSCCAKNFIKLWETNAVTGRREGRNPLCTDIFCLLVCVQNLQFCRLSAVSFPHWWVFPLMQVRGEESHEGGELLHGVVTPSVSIGFYSPETP